MIMMMTIIIIIIITITIITGDEREGAFLFVNLKHESSTLILFVGIRYSMRDLLSDLNNKA